MFTNSVDDAKQPFQILLSFPIEEGQFETVRAFSMAPVYGLVIENISFLGFIRPE